jgi:hypothetical protein
VTTKRSIRFDLATSVLSTIDQQLLYSGSMHNQPYSTQVAPSVGPELVNRLSVSARQQIPLDLAGPDAVGRFRIPIAIPTHAHNQSTAA